jgi:hypothetical protein
MRTRYVRDEKAIVHLQGIRWVKRTDQHYITNNKTVYELEVDYKPRSLLIKYETAAERDSLFDKLCEALVPPGIQTSTEGGEAP